MTALKLFLYILIGGMVQVALAAFIALIKHWRDYRFMQKRMAGLEVDTPEGEPILDGLKPGKATPWKGTRAFKVVRRETESPDAQVCSFYLEPEDGGALVGFKPGQFLTFNLDVNDPASGGHKTITRCYSLSDAPELATGGGRYRVSIKRVPAAKKGVPPGVSSNHFHDHVEEGDTLAVRSPSGHFFLERGQNPIVLIAGGIGITPMVSMLNDTLIHDEGREVWLFYGVRNAYEHAMKKVLERLDARYPNFHLRVCYSQPRREDELARDYHYEGRVSVNLLRKTLPFQIYDFYICGPTPMMKSIVPGLDDWGVPDQHIHFEAFGPASIERPNRKAAPKPEGPSAFRDEPKIGEGPSGPVNVTFSASGKTLEWDPSCESLLDFAEQNGVEMDSGCRAGGCGTCQTTIEEGEVSYNHAPDFDPEPGTCLACVCRPKSDVTVEA